MATQTQLRRGTAAQNNSFTGAVGELSYDTENKNIRVHDGSTAGGIEVLTDNGNIVINESSADVDFRVESNGNANMLFVDGGANAVGIGTSSPRQYFALHVTQSQNTGSGIVSENTSTGVNATAQVKYQNSGTTSAFSGLSGVNRSTYATLGPNVMVGSYTDSTAGITHLVDAAGPMTFATNSAERMRIDATGAVTMPAQPAFLAQVASAQTDLANYTNVLIFGTEIFDQNADFNPSNGIFTAPVTGKYMLSTFIGLDQIAATGTGVLQLQIVVSNRTVYAAFDPVVFDATSTKYTFTQSLLLDMDASDTAKIQVYMPVSTSTVDINTTSFFSGYLVA